MTASRPLLPDLKPGERSAFEVACPECGAPAGQLCRGLKIRFGREQNIHGARAALVEQGGSEGRRAGATAATPELSGNAGSSPCSPSFPRAENGHPRCDK